jgi:hypothetical protein
LKTKSHETAVDVAAYRAIDLIYHSYLTGLILKVSSQKSSSAPSVVNNWPASCPA